MNKYKHEFTVAPASESQESLDYVNRILKERDIAFAAKPLETSRFQVENMVEFFSYIQPVSGEGSESTLSEIVDRLRGKRINEQKRPFK